MQRKPVPRRRTVYAAATAVTGVIVAVGLFALVAQIATKPGSNAHTGGRTRAVFDVPVGAKTLTKEISGTGPVVFPALVGDLDIIIQHLGPDPTKGFLAFDARAAGAARRCSVQWKAERQLFVDPCSQQTYPPDGTGLTHHPVTVAGNGRVSVDLRTNLP